MAEDNKRECVEKRHYVSGTKRNRMLLVRVTDEELENLKRMAKEEGLHVSKLLRKMICILLIFMLFPLLPTNFFEVKAVEEEYPTFFYTYKDYESQKIGEFPHGLGQEAWVTPLTEEDACVESVSLCSATNSRFKYRVLAKVSMMAMVV